MVEEWELKDLRRELNSLEHRVDRFEGSGADLAELRRSVDRMERKDRERTERRDRWFTHIIWTLYVVALTTYIVLSVTGALHRH